MLFRRILYCGGNYDCRTLEEICESNGASGKNLKDKIKDLKTKIVLLNALLDVLDDLRLLGNDAAHIEAQVFEQIGEPEIQVSIEITKEILKGFYQLNDLEEKIRVLKTPLA